MNIQPLSKLTRSVVAAGLVVTLLLAGCGQRRDRTANKPTFAGETDSEYVLTLVFDLSGSYANAMANDGKAYEFAMQAIDHFTRNRDLMADQIVLAQISMEHDTLLWKGTPLQLRREFGSADKFRDFLLAKSDPNGSMVSEGVNNALKYVMTDPRVTSGDVRSATLVLSDMVDTHVYDLETYEERLDETLRQYASVGGVIGLYYVDQWQLPDWNLRLSKAGFSDFIVEADIVGEPKLPTFD